MCPKLARGNKTSCSGWRPSLLPGAYCKCVQDETPTSKRFLPAPLSGSASCECCEGCGEFVKELLLLGSGHQEATSRVGGLLQGI